MGIVWVRGPMSLGVPENPSIGSECNDVIMIHDSIGTLLDLPPHPGFQSQMKVYKDSLQKMQWW